MNPQPPDNHELLSGMLDGELSGADARRIEQAMREDPSLHDRLEELTAMRSSLLRGRPTGRLSKSFASQVVAAAQQRAASMDLDAPHWIPLSHDSVDAHGIGAGARVKSELSYRQRMWIPLGALVSACAIALFAFLTLPRPEPHPIADLPPFSDRVDPNQPSAPLDTPVGPAVLDVPANAVATNSGSPTVPVPAVPIDSEISAPRDSSSLPNRTDLQMAESSATPASEKVKVEDAERVKIDSQLATQNQSPRIDTSSMASAGANKESQTSSSSSDASKAPFMLMVVSVSIDRVARENNALNRILNEHGIASVEDLALSPEQLAALLSTGMAGSVSQNGAGVYFLKGYAKSLSSALDDICSQYKDFPEFGLNIAMDDSAKALIDQLDGIQVAANRGVARRLAAETPDGLVSRFAPGAKRSAPLSDKRREEFRSQAALPKLDLNPISHLLLIVRDAE
ncbi:anti-sigma factor family protein [Pirellula sp. SH-Sr6A]|uniref:anti-sigma factor family protein n=1 Tax=Pirellula sp. SH-Sr6A TaxID=1632865 RepID=UPI0011BA7CAF|nr:hypothetical protein [Pirellula sp. SH-Sr6A]